MAFKRSRKTFEDDIRKHEAPFVIYGTPLPPLDDDSRDDGSYVPVWKQEVTDDRGRKRLHGAFTGGYSAGYFNTVGSKEGWTPSTFVSSRSNRAKDQKNSTQMKPEDYMDAEDIREQEDSKQISTADGFAGFGTESDPRHRNTLLDVFRPSEDSMGIKLLNRMGWKQGQGIGPRVRRAVSGDENDSHTHLFAPDDVSMLSFSKKHDYKGLGYNGEADSLNSSSNSTTAKAKPAHPADEDDDDDVDHPGLSFMGRKKKSAQRGRGGFGIGVLNDTGSDEEDPYAMGPKISYNKTLGSDKKLKKKKPTSGIGAANPLLQSKPRFVSKKLFSLQHALRKCHDGRLPLTGFVLADELDSFSNMSLMDEKYQPPEVPTDWKPAKSGAEITTASTSDRDGSAYQSTAEVAKQSTHTAASRASLLGEQRLPGKSVFDFMTPEARQKLMKATGKTNLPPALSERLPGLIGDSSSTAIPSINIPQLEAATARAALTRADSGGFIPYAEDLDKRHRYRHFLELSAGLHPEGTLPKKPSDTSGTEDWLNELNEFVRAAEVFRPMIGAIASRFTSSSSSTVLNPDVATAESGNTNIAEHLLRRPASRPEDPAEVAAKLGMFGVMTRSISSFQPTRLVCKRFGVDMPIYMPQEASHHQHTTPHTPVPATTTPDISGQPPAPEFTSSTSYITNGKNGSATDVHETNSTSLASSKTLILEVDRAIAIDNDVVVVDPDTNDALEQEKPGLDVFKAIFGDSDSNDDDNE